MKIQKLVTNVAVLHDSDGTAFRVKSEPTLGCLVPTPCARGGTDKVMGGVHRRSLPPSFGRSVFSGWDVLTSVVCPFCRSAVRLFCRSVVLSFDRFVVRSFCRSAVLSFGRSVVRPFCRSVVLSFGRSVVRPLLLDIGT